MIKETSGSYAFFSVNNGEFKLEVLGYECQVGTTQQKGKNIFTTVINNWAKVIGLNIGIRKQCLVLVESQKQLQRPTFGAYCLQLKNGHGICLY